MELIDLKNSCRSCLVLTTELSNKDFFEEFEKCTGIQIDHDDKLPKSLCTKCTGELKVVEIFRIRSIETNVKLLNYLNECNNLDPDNLNSTETHSNDFSFRVLPENDEPLEQTEIVNDVENLKKDFAEDSNMICCYICNKKFSNKKEMMIHKKIHFYFKCKICKTCHQTKQSKHMCTVNKVENLNSVETLPDYEKIFKCHICNQELMHSRSLRNHLRSHTGEKPYLCDLCGLKFREEVALVYHTRAVHTKEKKFKCSFCPKAFTVSGKKRVHERVHTGEKPYQCNQCSRLFGSRSALTAHIRRHTKQNVYICRIPECEMGFYSFSSYQRHTWAHRGERPYECAKCLKTYLSKQNLMAHQKSVHNQLKDQVCEICKKRFSEKSTLNRHLRSIHKIETKINK